MEPFEIPFSKQAQKDIALLTPKQKEKLQEILQQVIPINPYAGKALKGDLSGSKLRVSIYQIWRYWN